MRLIIVSNRLPVRVMEEHGTLHLVDSIGGLATGLASFVRSFQQLYSGSDYHWFGWLGRVEDPLFVLTDEIRVELLEKKLHPIFLSAAEIDAYYNGFCNDTLWPLFHYFISFVDYREEYWSAYVRVNQKFCDEIIKFAKPDDVVWIHDYHLMLLPQLLRERMPSLRIGFFLHIPFPVFEIFRLLPNEWRKSLLYGLTGADVAGFHTHDYARYFTVCAKRILGAEQDADTIVTIGNRVTRVDAFPMGVDFDAYHNGSVHGDMRRTTDEFKRIVGGRKSILCIDRLDYTKGIINQLEAYELFLQHNKQWHSNILLFLVIVPSRTHVDRYREMKRTVDGIVGRVNGTFGSVHWTPIIYQFKSLSPVELAVLYREGDVALITPLRDGMNLIAKEYIASRKGPGVLILSEMAGAAQELAESLIVNPNHSSGISRALEQALSMPLEIQKERNRSMQERMKRSTVLHWAQHFVGSLLSRETSAVIDEPFSLTERTIRS